MNAKLDYLAVQIGAMQAANVPIIFAIYHETQPNGWFWWAQTSGPTFVNLWTYTFNYLTKNKGPTNIIWLMPFSGTVNSAFYPGKALVDISGPDEYDTTQNLTTFAAASYYGPARSVLGKTIPITLHETGTAPQPDHMFPTAAPWILFNIWATYENSAQNGVTYNSLSSLQAAYTSQYTITRDEVPNLK